MPVVGPLPILDVVSPSDLDLTSTSGLLNTDQLVTIGPSGKLHKTAARAYRALAFMCMAVGLPLTYTYGGTYRSYADQVTLFHQRYEYPPVPGRATKTWNGVKYSIRYVNGKPMAMAAVPGTSNHGYGLAVDTAFDVDPRDGIGPDDAATITAHPQWHAFKTYVLACGFSWEATSEPWHIRLVTGDTPTQTVLNYEALINQEDEDMAKAKLWKVAGDPAIFAVTDALTCYWMRANVDTALKDNDLVELETTEVLRTAYKGLEFRGAFPGDKPQDGYNGPTFKQHFNIVNGVVQP